MQFEFELIYERDDITLTEEKSVLLMISQSQDKWMQVVGSVHIIKFNTVQITRFPVSMEYATY